MCIKIKVTRPENCVHYGVLPGAIITLDVEGEYLPCCVSSEIYENNSRTPLEAKKAQAIAARTYLAAHIVAGTTIDDTANYQAYKWKPLDTIPNCIQACQETTGEVLAYEGGLIIAWYSNSNGGRTKRSDEAWSAFKPWTVSQPDPWDTAGRAKWGDVKASHGVGMSQIGAAYAASIGISCEDILGFYYPGSKITDMVKESDTMAKPSVAAVRKTALACAAKVPPIPYVWGAESAEKQDCQGHIEYCVRANGGSMSYAGSNDMYRNACTWVGTIAQAKAQGKYIPGALLFQVKKDGKEPDRYIPDGKGNSAHVGFLWNEPGAEVTHASSTRERVLADNMSTGWTHVGLAKAIDYNGQAASAPPAVQDPIADGRTGTVTAEGSGLNMRETPQGAYMLKIPTNARIIILETVTINGELWGKTRWEKGGRPYTGWVLMTFVELCREEDSGIAKILSVVIPVASEEAANQLLDMHPGAYLVEVQG